MRSAFLCAVLASSLLGVGAAHAAGRDWTRRPASQREVDVSSGRDDGAVVIELGGSYRLLEGSL